MLDSLQPHGLWPARLLCPWDSPGKNIGVGRHALLQGIFLTQELNPCLLCLLHWQMGSLPLGPPGKQVYSKSYITKYNIETLRVSLHTAHGILKLLIINLLKVFCQNVWFPYPVQDFTTVRSVKQVILLVGNVKRQI